MLALAAGLLAPHPGGAVEVLPRTDYDAPPRNRSRRERAISRNEKRLAEKERLRIRAGVQGNGLWRRNAAHGKVRGW